ncbi:MAG: TetR/AcrR family transcriptional regulator [Chloroflexota bacterium]
MAVAQARKVQRRDRILDAALSVFARKGYRDAAVDDVGLEAETSKGGIYFHFANKQAIFLALLDRTSNLLLQRVEAAIGGQPDPIAKTEAALHTVLELFASHRALARLFLVEALGAGREFHERLAALRGSFARTIQQQLEEAVRDGSIPPLDAAVAGTVWFGALNEVVTRWVLEDAPGPLEDLYPALRVLLLRSIGAPEGSRIGAER